MSQPKAPETEAPKKKGFSLPKIKLPGLKLAGLKLPKIKLPKFTAGKKIAAKIQPTREDLGFFGAMLLVGGLSAGSAALAVRFAMPAQVVVQRPAQEDQEAGRAQNPHGFPDIVTGPNVPNDYSLSMERPVVAENAYLHPQSSVIGYVSIGARTLVAPQASIRGDIGKNIFIGEDCGVLDGVVIRGLPTEEKGKKLLENIVMVNGEEFSVHVADRVTLEPQSQVCGPVAIGEDTFIGMQAVVSKARVGTGCVLEPRCAAIGVTIPDGRFIPAGMVVTTQEAADELPKITPGYLYETANARAVHASAQLAEGYRGLHPLAENTDGPAPTLELAAPEPNAEQAPPAENTAPGSGN